MNIITLFSIQDLLRNNIWPRLLEILIKDFTIEFFEQYSYSHSRNKYGPIIDNFVDLMGNKTLLDLRATCKQFKIIFTNDFYWVKFYKFDLSPFHTIINMSTGENSFSNTIPAKLLNIITILMNIPCKIEKNFLNEIMLHKCSCDIKKRKREIKDINEHRKKLEESEKY